MSDNNLPARVGERIFAGAIGLVFAGQFMMALRYPPDPRLFPLIVAAAGFILAGMLVLGVGLHDHTLGAPEPMPREKLVLTLAVSPIYGIGLYILGYWIATIITVPVVAWLLGYRNKAILAAVTIGVTLALGVLFPLLGVYLPVGLLPNLVGL